MLYAMAVGDARPAGVRDFCPNATPRILSWCRNQLSPCSAFLRWLPELPRFPACPRCCLPARKASSLPSGSSCCLQQNAKKKNKKQSNQTSVSVCWVLHKGRGGCSVKNPGPAHHRSERLTKLLGCGPCRNNYSEFPLLKGEAGLFWRLETKIIAFKPRHLAVATPWL